MEDARPKKEQRAIPRFTLQLPVTVTTKDGDLQGAMAESRDVSSHGICFFCDQALEPGLKVGFTIVLPREVTMSDALRIRGNGTVVRTEPGGNPNNQFKVAISIEDYEFVAEDELSAMGGEADAPPAL
jgi:hypothetical protein